MPPAKGKRSRPAANNSDTDASLGTQEALLAAVQAMQQELAALRQIVPNAATTSATTAAATTSIIPSTRAAPAAGTVHATHSTTRIGPSGAREVALPVSGISLMQWIGMKLDSFDGSGSPVDAADWLTYVVDKMDVFEVVYGDRVRYGTQLLKGEAQVWWRGVQSSHTTPGSMSWHVFVTQFER